jgi:hypothetical protein
MDDDADAARLGWVSADRPARVRIVVDAYGLKRRDRPELLSILDRLVAQSGEWFVSKVETGDPNFTKMWNELGQLSRHDRRRHWWAANRGRIEAAVD